MQPTPLPPQDPNTGPPLNAPGPPSDNFDLKWMQHELTTYENPWSSGWDLKRCLDARDAHGYGNFFVSALFEQIAMSNTTVLKALNQRVAPSLNMKRRVTGDGERIRAEAGRMILPEGATSITRKVVATTFQGTAMMGFHVWQNVVKPRAGGGRLDFTASPWPTGSTYWNPYKKVYQAITNDGLIDIVHGDGKWTVFEPYGRRSFLMGAVYSLAVVYADIMYAYRDRSANGTAWGAPKLVAGLPEDIKLTEPDARVFKAEIMKAQAGRQSGILKPFGATIEKLEMMGMSGPIFQKIIDDRKSDIADALTGQSGTSGPTGAAHGYAVLFEGVLYSLIARDCGEFDAGVSSGFFAPWYIVNTGKARETAPMLESLVPDPDEAARVADVAARYAAVGTTLTGLKSAGVVIDQPLLDRLCREFRIDALVLVELAKAAAAIATSSTPALFAPPGLPAPPGPPALPGLPPPSPAAG